MSGPNLEGWVSMMFEKGRQSGDGTVVRLEPVSGFGYARAPIGASDWGGPPTFIRSSEEFVPPVSVTSWGGAFSVRLEERRWYDPRRWFGRVRVERTPESGWATARSLIDWRAGRFPGWENGDAALQWAIGFEAALRSRARSRV